MSYLSKVAFNIVTLPVASTYLLSDCSSFAYLANSKYCGLDNLWLCDSKLSLNSAGLSINSTTVSTSDSIGCPCFNIAWSSFLKLSILILLAVRFFHPPGSANAICFAAFNSWL